MQSLQWRHRGRYGRRRMHRALRGEVGVINEKRVGRLMRQHGLQSRLRRPFRVVTTDSRHAYPVAPNVLARDFQASAPDRKWLVDLTFVATDEGWLYLALVLDLFSRKFIGRAMSERIDEDLALQALVMALDWRRPTGELMHHSDQYRQGHKARVVNGDERPAPQRHADLLPSHAGSYKKCLCPPPHLKAQATQHPIPEHRTSLTGKPLKSGLRKRYNCHLFEDKIDTKSLSPRPGFAVLPPHTHRPP